MKGHPTIIKFLNQGLEGEFTAIRQYWVHSKILEDQGITSISKAMLQSSIDEMKHAKYFINRIVFLGAIPKMDDPINPSIKDNLKDMLESDLKAEVDTCNLYRKAIVACTNKEDFISKQLFENLLAEEEKHSDWLETQLQLIDKIGIERYILLKATQ